MHYYLRYPAIIAAGYAAFVFVVPLFYSQQPAENFYSLGDYNQDMSKLYRDIGKFSQQRRDFQAAIKAYTQALENNPYYLECYDCLGTCFELCRKLDLALQTYLKAMSISPDFIATRMQKTKSTPFPEQQEDNPIPFKQKWTGQPLENKTIYVYTEDSLSNTIFFLRFLRQLIKPGTKVLLNPQPELVTLLTHSFGGVRGQKDIEIISPETKIEHLTFDYYTPLHSIPSFLQVSYTNIPDRDGYLNVEPKKVASFKEQLFNNNAFKIGIIWQGNPRDENDKERSIPLTFFYSLATIPNVKVYSLQKINGLEQLKQVPPSISIINLDPHLKDIADLAAAIKNLDLLVSIDSFIAHLGGALGQKTWILLPHVTDWRWFSFSEGDQSCWYTNVKKFRQKRAGDWAEVFRRIGKQITLLTQYPLQAERAPCYAAS